MTDESARTRRWFLKASAVTGTAIATIGTRAVALAQRLGYGSRPYGQGPYG